MKYEDTTKIELYKKLYQMCVELNEQMGGMLPPFTQSIIDNFEAEDYLAVDEYCSKMIKRGAPVEEALRNLSPMVIGRGVEDLVRESYGA